MKASGKAGLAPAELVYETVGALALAFVIAHVLAVIVVTAPVWLVLRRSL